MPKTVRDFETILEKIRLPFGWELNFTCTDNGTYYLQVGDPNAVCNMTGLSTAWRGRKWMLSGFMTDGEVVQTAFKAVLTALEHEARELFLYRGVSVFDPHYDIDKLVELRKSEGAIKEREEQ